MLDRRTLCQLGLAGLEPLRRRQLAGVLVIGVGASALANVVTRRVGARAGFWPAVASAAALSGVGVYLVATSEA